MDRVVVVEWTQDEQYRLTNGRVPISVHDPHNSNGAIEFEKDIKEHTMVDEGSFNKFEDYHAQFTQA